MTHLLNFTIEELAAQLAAAGQPAYRAKQISRWVWQEGRTDFAAMTDLPAPLREELARRYVILAGRAAARSDSDDGVTKLLLEWPDGERIETVLIPSADRATVCVSTQVGCAMGCLFCASGEGGLRRNLTSGEIIEQIVQFRPISAKRISHVVFMGMGEPLANYDNTVAAVRSVIDPKRLAISARHVTVSTVGIPDKIRRLATEGLAITLALSLHAPNDALRREIMPAAAKYPLEEILAAAEAFFDSRHRQVTLEYIVLPGINDTNVCAAALAGMARRLAANINLIGYNAVPDQPFRHPSPAEMERFRAQIEHRHANVEIRRSRGQAADAACGQLRRRMET